MTTAYRPLFESRLRRCKPLGAVRCMFASLWAGVAALATVFALSLTASRASAYCPPGQLFCADLQFHAQVGYGYQYQPYPPPPPVVYVPVAPAPPPQPPPPPPQPQVYVVQPPPQTNYVYVQQAPQQAPQLREPTLGIRGYLAGSLSDSVQMGGLGAAIRYRPRPHFAFDFNIAGYAGKDYLNFDRVEVPMFGDFVFFVNPKDTFQLYGLAGVGFSFAHAEGYSASSRANESIDSTYFGGELGVGVELRLSPWFALNGDIRAFMRQRVATNDKNPEFVERNDSGTTTGRASDTSAGALLTLGATIYF